MILRNNTIKRKVVDFMNYFTSNNELEAQRQQINDMQQQQMNNLQQQQLQAQMQNQYQQNQMLQAQIQSQQYNQNMGYQQPVYNVNGTMKMPRKRSKAEIYSYMQQCSQCSSMKKITDTPNRIRHICITGLHFLDKMTDMPSPNTGELIPYYFCPDCRKLFVYSEFM